jgi:hypothetical protein
MATKDKGDCRTVEMQAYIQMPRIPPHIKQIFPGHHAHPLHTI